MQWRLSVGTAVIAGVSETQHARETVGSGTAELAVVRETEHVRETVGTCTAELADARETEHAKETMGNQLAVVDAATSSDNGRYLLGQREYMLLLLFLIYLHMCAQGRTKEYLEESAKIPSGMVRSSLPPIWICFR